LQRAAVLAEAAADWPLAAQALERLAETESDRARAFAVRQRLATICEEKLDDPERAVRALATAAPLRPLDVVLIEKIATLYGRLGDREALGLHLDRAAAALREAAMTAPGDLAKLEGLARIYRRQKNYPGTYVSFAVLAGLGAGDATVRKFLIDAAAA